MYQCHNSFYDCYPYILVNYETKNCLFVKEISQLFRKSGEKIIITMKDLYNCFYKHYPEMFLDLFYITYMELTEYNLSKYRSLCCDVADIEYLVKDLKTRNNFNALEYGISEDDFYIFNNFNDYVTFVSKLIAKYILVWRNKITLEINNNYNVKYNDVFNKVFRIAYLNIRNNCRKNALYILDEYRNIINPNRYIPMEFNVLNNMRNINKIEFNANLTIP